MPIDPAQRTLVATMMLSVIAVLPVFLTGGLSVLIIEDIRMSPSQLGVAVSCYYVTGAAASLPCGRFAEHVGHVRAMAIAITGTVVALSGIGLLAGAWWHLAGFLLLAGTANALAQPAANLALSRNIPAHRQGMAFGLKQATIPAASMFAGFAVPLVGLTLGWRYAFLIATLAMLAYPLVSRGLPDRQGGAGSRGANRAGQTNATLVILATGAAFAVVASSTLAPFYVSSAISHGFEPGEAGWLMSLGGFAGITVRVLAGWLADRRNGGHLRVVAYLLSAGAAGFAFLGSPTNHVALILATTLAFGAGWGWAGLFHYAVVRSRSDAPAAATGAVLTGMRTGGIVGPATFGFIVERAGYRTAWWAMASVTLVSVGLMLLGRRSLIREKSSAPGS